MRNNPVYKREMAVRARSPRIPVLIMLFNGILAAAALLNMYSSIVQVRISNTIRYESFLQLYAFVATLEFLLLMFIMPALTSASISGERERQTLDLMLTTEMKTWEIVVGKLAAAFVNMFLVVVSSFPLVAVVFVYGGITGKDMLLMLICLVVSALFSGSLGICCSSLFKRSTVSTVAAYAVLALTVVGTYGVNSFAYSMARMDLGQSGYMMGMIGEQAASSGGFLYTLLVNPSVTFLLILQDQTATGTGILEMYGNRGPSLVTDHWVAVSSAVQLALSALFVFIAIKMVRKRGIGRNA